jgi:molybdenum cofactor cytidylyltransferase
MTGLKKEAVAILLAAGDGSRLGGDKMFVDLGGKPLIERTLRPYRKARCVEDIVIVVPAGEAQRFGHLRSPTCHVFENPDPSRGMISSIRVGLETGWAQERDFLIAPADVPFVKPEMIDQLVKQLVIRDAKIVLPAYRGLGGHPGVFHRSLHNDFFLLGETSGTREILFRYREGTVRMNLHDPDVCFDIDTAEHLAMALDPGARWARVEQMVEQKRLGQITKF